MGELERRIIELVIWTQTRRDLERQTTQGKYVRFRRLRKHGDIRYRSDVCCVF